MMMADGSDQQRSSLCQTDVQKMSHKKVSLGDYVVNVNRVVDGRGGYSTTSVENPLLILLSS
jgi:hypothetical protein